MAGNMELSTQGLTSAFRVELAQPSAPPPSQKADDGRKVATPKREEVVPGISEEAVSDVADAFNSVAKAIDRNLQFSVDKETGRIVIKVTDGETGELIRVIPPEGISGMKDSLGSLVGLMFNEQS